MKDKLDKLHAGPFIVIGEDRESYTPYGKYIGLIRIDKVCITYYHPHPQRRHGRGG